MRVFKSGTGAPAPTIVEEPVVEDVAVLFSTYSSQENSGPKQRQCSEGLGGVRVGAGDEVGMRCVIAECWVRKHAQEGAQVAGLGSSQ